MVMDYLRRTYKSKMRLFHDAPDVLVPGQWWECTPGAKPLPFPHTFGSSVWIDHQRADWYEGVGEVSEKKVGVRRKRPERLTGQGYCGSRGAFLYGDAIQTQGSLSLDADGIPTCCPTSRPPSKPGDADDGTAVQYLRTWSGDADDGTARQWRSENQIGSGGDAEDGVAAQIAGSFQIGGGGDAEDGAAVQVAGPYLQTGVAAIAYNVNSGQGASTETVAFAGCPLTPRLMRVVLSASPGSMLNGVIIPVAWTGTRFVGAVSACASVVQAQVFVSGTGVQVSLHQGGSTMNSAVGSPVCTPFVLVVTLTGSLPACGAFNGIATVN